ncbi:growth/differentiation factor 8-like [Ptychodera flava]|uniref:growth/differentiation factor 8-like n=1 Tax=Ptychodera flava TaxID=63121 RepID=UPI00396A2B00
MKVAVLVACFFIAASAASSEEENIEELSPPTKDRTLRPTESPEDEKTPTTTEMSSDKPNEMSCKNCDPDEARKQHLLYIKFQIMDRLGMKHPPQVNGSNIPSLEVVQHLLESELHDDFDFINSDGEQHDDGEMDSEDSDDEYYVNAKRIIVFAKKLPYHTKPQRPHTSESFFFKFSQKVLQNDIAAARLWVYVKPRIVLQDTSTAVKVFRIQSRDRSNAKRVLIEARKINVISNSGGWQSFNLTSVVQDWFAAMWTNWGIEVEAVDHNGDSIMTPSLHETNSKKPFLEIQTQQRRRRKRSVQGLECPANRVSFTACCRHPLTVNFKELEMDWIIAPESYQAYYCTGGCRQLVPSRAFFLNQFGIEHCCGPSKMSNLSLLYYNDDKTIIFGKIPKMVIDRCSCF